MPVDPSTTKYVIKAKIQAEGVVEKPDVVGAIFGQTEGLLGEDLDLRDLQKTGRMGRIEVEVQSKKGRSEGTIIMPSSLDQVETAILAAALETIDRVGPCKASIRVNEIEDVRVAKKQRIVQRAKDLLSSMIKDNKQTDGAITDEVRQSVQVQEIISYGADRSPAGPNVGSSDAIIIVEGRSDVLNLLKFGIKNAIAVEGTNIPKTIKDLSKERIVTVFVDGDRGGELILRELLQVAEIDFIAQAPRNREVEELTQKQIMKALRNKMPSEQFVEMHGMQDIKLAGADEGPPEAGPQKAEAGQSGGKGFQPGPRARDDRGPPVRGGQRNGRGPPPPREDQAADTRPTERRGGFFSGITDRLRGGRGEKRLSEEQIQYKDILNQLSGSFKAKLLNMKGHVIKEVPVRDLAEALSRPPEGLKTVIFDGVITQRILDLASEKNVKTLVGVKFGSITKQPTDLEILTKADLE
jgi:DNA primase